MTKPPVPQRRDTKVPLVFALGLVLLAVVVTVTWAITWSVTGNDDNDESGPGASTTVEPAPETELIDTVRATTESLYNFTPDTITATMKTAQATLCGDALAQWNETAQTLPGIVSDTNRSVVTSNAHYGIAAQDETTATVLALFTLTGTENNTPAAPATTAIEFTVERTEVPMCISSMKVL